MCKKKHNYENKTIIYNNKKIPIQTKLINEVINPKFNLTLT